MKSIFKIFICSFILIAFSSCDEDGFNENGIGTIEGTVVEEGDNTPLLNAKITTVPATNTVFTDDNGEYTIENVAAGDYSVQAELNEYISAVQAANVTDAAVTNVVFELVKSIANNRPPLAPTLVYPPDNGTELGFTVEFLWTTTDPDDDDLTYTLELRNGNNNAVEVYEVGQDTVYTVNNLAIATNYFWQVTASDDINDPVSSAISEFNTITELNNAFLFVKDLSGNSVIYSGRQGDANSNNVNVTQLTSASFNSFRPRRNYNVEKVAFLRTVGGNTQLFTMNFDGTNVSQITSAIPLGGFREDQLDFCWALNGQLLFYPYFDKLYKINPDGGGAQLIYQTPDGSLISEVDVPDFNDDIAVIKTNDVDGYNARIVVINHETDTEQTVILEGMPGAVGGVSFSAAADKVLYSWDVTGNENPTYRIFESRMYYYDIPTFTPIPINTDAVTGENDLDPRWAPSEGLVVFTRRLNNFNSIPNVFTVTLQGSKVEDEIFTEAFMPDWE